MLNRLVLVLILTLGSVAIPMQDEKGQQRSLQSDDQYLPRLNKNDKTNDKNNVINKIEKQDLNTKVN